MRTRYGRRGFLAALSATVAGTPTANSADFQQVGVAISAGQSWRVNAFPSFRKFGIDPCPGTLLSFEVQTSRGKLPLPNSSGMNLAWPIVGITSYLPSGYVTIGRCAAIAQQLLRRRASLEENPILEFCAAYPASSWKRGPGGGLGPGSVPWSNQSKLIDSAEKFLPHARFRSVSWTQGGSFNHMDPEFTIRDLSEMTAAYDALNLPGTAVHPLSFFIGMPGSQSTQSDLSHLEQYQGIYEFCRRNKNGRSWGTTPWYQWPFSGPKDAAYGRIHTGPYGTVRHGELEGYAKFVVEDEGSGQYHPLWRSLKRPIIRVSDNAIKVPFDRPSGKAFQNRRLGWKFDPHDGIAQALHYGWRVKVKERFLNLEATIVGLDVFLKSSDKIPTGVPIEISYAMYGPGGTDPGLHAGVFGNLMMEGPASVFFPAKTIDVWAWQFLETIVF